MVLQGRPVYLTKKEKKTVDYVRSTGKPKYLVDHEGERQLFWTLPGQKEVVNTIFPTYYTEKDILNFLIEKGVI